MKKTAIRLFVAATIAAVLGFFLFGETSEPKYHKVLVATTDISSNEPLNEDNVAFVELREDAIIVTDYISDIESIKDKVVTQPILKGHIVSTRVLADKPIEEIKPGHRLYPIPVSVEFLGSARTGDKVDVLYNPGDSTRSTVILSNVTIYALVTKDGHVVNNSNQEKVAGVAELLVTVEEAGILFDASETGTLKLVKYLPESRPVTANSLPVKIDTSRIEGSSFEDGDFNSEY